MALSSFTQMVNILSPLPFGPTAKPTLTHKAKQGSGPVRQDGTLPLMSQPMERRK
jgi:hypothetical protein